MEAIASSDVSVNYEPKRNWQGRSRNILSEGVVDYLGETFFSNVVYISIMPSTDEDMLIFSYFPNVDEVFIHGLTDGGNTVSDEGIRRLTVLPHLRDLRIFAHDVDSDQLQAITEISTLESLCVEVVAGNTSLAEFAQMQQLDSLSLDLGHSADIRNLRLPPNLEKLSVAVDHLNGADLAQVFSGDYSLSEFTLLVHDYRIDHMTIATLGNLTHLTSLRVTSCDLLNDWPPVLTRLVKLQYLSLTKPDATAEEVSRFGSILPSLRQANPTLKRIRGPSDVLHEFP